MTFDPHNQREAPLDQFQDVSRNHNDHVSASRSTSTSFSSTVSSTDDDIPDKQAKATCATPVDRVLDGAETPDRPDVYRVISYGAAAPYVTPDFSTFRDHPVTTRPASHRTASVISEKKLEHTESHLPPLSRVSTDAQGFTYPEGGLQAWLCVLGSFCGMMGALGMMNTVGTIQTYISSHQLAGTNESTIGWIFSIYTFLAFFCGIQIGPVFDAFGPRWLVAPGSLLVLITWFCLGLCTRYWHFIVVYGICGGVGTSLVFTPAVTSIGHFFFRRRGLCTGIAAVGGSMGGVVYPLLLQALFPRLGFAWATRIIGFINIVLMVFANLFIRARLPPRKVTKEAIMPDLKIFRDPIFALTTLAVFFVEWALFIPLTYLTSYSIAHGVDTNLSYQIIAFMNVGSCFGRWLPGFVADKVGRFNTMIATIALCLVTTFAIWLPAGDSAAAIIVYAVLFGFASGSGISLTPVCVSQLCKVENYGRYYATCYTMVSFACLTGVPIAGSLISAAGGAYWGVIVFTGVAYSAAVASFIAARVLGAGWRFKKIY